MHLQNNDLTTGFLNLSNSGIGDKEVRNICTLHTYLVDHLSLDSNNITHIAIKRISTVKWDRLKTLYIGLNKIGNKGCKFLSKEPFCHLKDFGLNGNQIGKQGLMHLSKVPWKKLTRIFLSENHFNGGTSQFIRSKLGNSLEIFISKSELTYPDILYLLLLTPKDLYLNLLDNLFGPSERDKFKGQYMEKRKIRGQVEFQWQ